jgi:calcineurin-like phosphoesterase family protein
MTTFYTADLHLGHNNIIHHAYRPFNNVQDMDSAIINNWHEVVKRNDTVYILGDFAWKLWYYHEVLPNLPGRIFLIPGNHDEKVLNVARRYVNVIDRIAIIKENGNPLVLSHYPLESWYNSGRGVYHLHGHLHGQDHHGELRKLRHRIDVGVDCQDFYPATFEQIRDRNKLKCLLEGPTTEQNFAL